MFISNKRLKLYDTSIEICINKKCKEKLRKIAYKNKLTMSEYIRNLINCVVSYNDINDLDNKINYSSRNINKAISLLGGTVDE